MVHISLITVPDGQSKSTVFRRQCLVSKIKGSRSPYDSNTELRWYEHQHVHFFQKQYLNTNMEKKSSKFSTICTISKGQH